MGQWSGGKKAEMRGMTKGWTLDSDGWGQVLAPALASQAHRLSRRVYWSTAWVRASVKMPGHGDGQDSHSACALEK